VETGEQVLPADILSALHGLVDAHRATCLWFMREDYLPRTVREAEQALTQIEVNGDRSAWQQARSLRLWLSRITSVRS
jgi:hypothetical protein